MAKRPAMRDVVGMARAVAKGSPIDRPKSVARALIEVGRDTPPDSPLTMGQLLARDDCRDLRTAKVGPGQPAFGFELPRYEFADGFGTTSLESVRLSAFRGVRPVVLIFGSYT